jgi:hypothetical protein
MIGPWTFSLNRSGCFSAAFAVIFAALLAGCTAPPSGQPVAFDAPRYTPIYESALTTLRDMGFAIDRQDHRFGVISTLPLGAPTVVEPWRRTNTTFGQAMESTLNDQRRIVRVYLERAGETTAGASVPGDDGADDSVAGAYQLRIEVQIQRRQMPAQRLSGSTTIGRMRNQLREVPAPLREKDVPITYWMPVGRDGPLEDRLIQQIMRKSKS